ncbi:major facilitator superfamily domain-containing protein [Aspergillus multicolor]|uniref:major facilitator superfamily domain-containing protein n=1 Tax=Aspergillus multicolor TaxID=41759 RepID=UPI003CCD671C
MDGPRSPRLNAEAKHQLDHADVALEFLETHEVAIFTTEEEKSVVRKIDCVLMPLMIVSYTIQYMDKSVMAQSAVYDLQDSLGLEGQDYSWCSSIFYFGYLAFQPIAARILAHFPLGRFVAITSLLWAIVLFCTAGARSFAGLMALRFFLGMTEAGISPAYVLITGSWYRKHEIPLRITLWYCGNGCAIILQSFIAYGIGHINNTGIPVWRWFFIIFGIVGLVWAVVLWVYMPDTPVTAMFLSDREKTIAVERLRENRTGIATTEFKKEQCYEALLDLKVWYGFLYAIACVVPSSAVANFGGLIIKGFGYDTFATSLLNTPLGLTENIALLTTGLVTYYFPNTRCLMQFLCNVPSTIGAVLVYALPESNKVGRLIAFYCTNFTNGSLPMMFALTTANIAGHTKRATASAVLFLGYSTAFIIGPQFFLDSEAPQYPTAFKTMIITYGVACLAPGLYWGYVQWLNRLKANKAQDEATSEYVENEEFLDLTDKQQARFIYST